MSSLAEATHQVAATMTGVVDRLAERDLVERQADPATGAPASRAPAGGQAALDQVRRAGRPIPAGC
jgi:hypothetical protein